MPEVNIQKLIAVIGIGIVFLAASGLIGYQIVMRSPLDPFLVGSWGLLVGQYVRLLGIDQGAATAASTITAMNGGASQNVASNTAALKENTAAHAPTVGAP